MSKSRELMQHFSIVHMVPSQMNIDEFWSPCLWASRLSPVQYSTYYTTDTFEYSCAQTPCAIHYLQQQTRFNTDPPTAVINQTRIPTRECTNPGPLPHIPTHNSKRDSLTLACLTLSYVFSLWSTCLYPKISNITVVHE
jgi:hypothetical protein